MTTTIAGIKIPDSIMARAATELVRDTEPDLLYNHSRRVFLFGALSGERKKLKYDPELLYIGAMFHDMGLIDAYSSKTNRFEVDGANAARDFLTQYGANEYDIEQVWASIALHTTPGVPEHMKPVVALVTAGVEMMCLGSPITSSVKNNGFRWLLRIRARRRLKTTSSMCSRTARSRSPKPRSAMSRPTS